jgi:hypothetical protein
MSDVKVILHKQIIPLNGAEWLDVDARATAASLTLPAYIRSRCDLAPWLQRGAEMADRSKTPGRRPKLALERRPVTITLTAEERERLIALAREASATLPQYIRTRCELQVRNTSLPGTKERDCEEDDAWERLTRLGLEAEAYFPPG